MTENKAVFTKYRDRFVLIHTVQNRTEHIYAYDSLDGLDMGTIINCRVDSQAPNIGACFAAYSCDRLAFVQKEIKNGTVLPLMFKKEAHDGKKAVFTDKLSIGGEYVVVSDGGTFIKASTRIPEPERGEMTAHFRRICEDQRIGIIIRTKTFTEEDGLRKAEEELSLICNKLKEIKQSSEHLVQYSILYRPLPSHISDLLYLIAQGIDEVVCDDSQIMDKLSDAYESLSGRVSLSDRVSLRFYEDELLPLCKLYSFDAKISEALSRKVYLKSGAYITFDTTEALTAIDVNSAQNEKKGDKEDTFLSVNLEAAREIARQIRIRNISGMIIVDFINMQSDDNYDKLSECLKNELRSDRVRCRFVDFTALHLAELIRDREGRTLYRILGD